MLLALDILLENSMRLMAEMESCRKMLTGGKIWQALGKRRK